MEALSSDLRELYEANYHTLYFFDEFLHKVVTVAELNRESAVVQERIRSDMYGLYKKCSETGELEGEGLDLVKKCQVSRVHKAQTTSGYLVDVCLDFASQIDEEKATHKTKKRKRLTLGSSVSKKIQLWFKFEELAVGSTAGSDECCGLCKTVTMSVWASHDFAQGKRLLVDFKYYAGSRSPSEIRNEISYHSKDANRDDEYRRATLSTKTQQKNGKSEITHQKGSDYYCVYVDKGALVDTAKLVCESVCGLLEEQSTLCAGGGQNFLLLLLSMPYVDEAWGIHDAVMDHAYPECDEGTAEEEGDDDEEEVSE